MCPLIDIPKVNPTRFVYVLTEISRGASQTLLAKLLVRWGGGDIQ